MKLHEEWLLKANHDLRAAKLLKTDNDLLDTAIYHTQQCAEKSLKGFLAFKNREIPKTHHLKVLLECCISINTEFSSLISESVFLSPFATEFRYPDDILIPEPEDLQMAIVSAEVIYEFVVKLTK